MQPYVSSARRYWFWLIAILALVWGAGLAAAYVEFRTTYEAQTTIWVLRASPDLSASNPDDPSVPLIQTSAKQQADLLNQLLQTRSFTYDVVARTSLGAALESTSDESELLDDVRKHFHVQTLGPNMVRLSYTARDPRVAFEMVQAALDVRADRVSRARMEATGALSALYQREFELAEAQALDAQRELERFTESHRGPLSEVDQHRRDQLRLSLDFAEARVRELRGRMDRSFLVPALLGLSGLEFQVVDPPRQPTSPSGGTRPALTLAAVAIASGAALATLLVIVGTFLANHVASPADVGRLAPAKLFASIPRVTGSKGQTQQDLRTALAAIAFGSGTVDAGERRR